jgi:hypothetical protein
MGGSYRVPTTYSHISYAVNMNHKVGFEVLTAVSMKIAVFWVVAPDYTVLQPRRQQSS